MRKVQTNRRNRIFGLIAMFAMAIGVGVSLAPKDLKINAAETHSVNITRNSFPAGATAYAEKDFSATGTDNSVISGKGVIYAQANTQHIQFRQTSPGGVWVTSGMPGPIVSIEMKQTSGSTTRAIRPYLSTDTVVYQENYSTYVNSSSAQDVAPDAATTWTFDSASDYRYVFFRVNTSYTVNMEYINISYEVEGGNQGDPDPDPVEGTTYTETFTGHKESGTAYTTTSTYTSADNGFPWSLKGRADATLDGKAWVLGNAADGSYVQVTATGGISTFSLDTVRYVTNSNARTLELLVNDVSKGTFSVNTTSNDVQKWTIKNINVEGNVVIKVVSINTGSRGATIVDNFTWTTYSAGEVPETGSMELDTYNVSLDIMETHQIDATYEPERAQPNFEYSVTASNPADVVSVGQDGLIRGLRQGAATVKVATTDGSDLDKTVSVTVSGDYDASVLTPAAAHELSSGTDVIVRGKVMTEVQDNGTYAIQVGDRGILTYGINGLAVGNDVIIIGKLGAYAGLPQLSNATEVINYGASTTAVSANVVTSYAQLNNPKLAGTLVEIEGLEYDGEDTFVDGALSSVNLSLDRESIEFRSVESVPSQAVDSANSVLDSMGPVDLLNVTTTLSWYNGPQLTLTAETSLQRVARVFGTLDRIDLNTDDVKLTYYVGETFSLDGLVVTAYDALNIDKDVTNSENLTSSLAVGHVFEEIDEGSKTITISYVEGSATEVERFKITVLPEPTWTKTTLEYPGGATINMPDTGNNAATVGLDPDLFNVSGSKGGAQNNVGLNTAGNMRLYFHADGGNTLSVAISGDREIQKIVFNFLGTVAEAEIKIDGVVHPEYNGVTPPSNGSITIDQIAAKNFSIQNVRTASNTQIWIDSIDIYYQDNVYDEAKQFADFVMGLTDKGDVTTNDCEANFMAAWDEWDKISSEDVKTVFKTHADFAEARARFTHWAFVNLDVASLDELDNGGGNVQIDSYVNKPLNATLIIGLLGLTTIAGYYFLSRKEKLVR